jgi:hypothetical protein
MNSAKTSAGIIVVCISLVGCATDQEHISVEEFCEMYQLPMGTIKYSKYIGVSDGRAVIELHEMSTLGTKSWDKKTYWTEASGVERECISTNK